MIRAVEPLAVLAAALFAFGPHPAPADHARVLARRIEERHRGIGGMTARFVQTYRSGVLGREVVERGTLKIKPPGRMLWEYREPERKTFVSDGTKFYFYVPADRQVIVKDQAGERGVALTLLAGRGDLLSEFDVELEPTAGARNRLRLTPRRADPDVDRVSIEVDDSGRIHAIEVLDLQGNLSQFRFDAVRENVALPDRLFRFEVPPGVEQVVG